MIFLFTVAEVEERRRNKTFTEVQRLSVVACINLFRDSESMRVRSGFLQGTLDKLGTSKSFAAKLTLEWDEKMQEGAVFPDIKNRNKGSKSRLSDVVSENLVDLHFLTEGRYSCLSLSVRYEEEFGAYTAPGTLCRHYRGLGVTVTRSYLKPLLKPVHRVARANCVLSPTERLGHGVCRLLPPGNRVRVDERWSYTEQLRVCQKRLPEEDRREDHTTQRRSATRRG